IYDRARPALERYLQTVQFDEAMAHAIAGFSLEQVGWFILVLFLAVAVLTAILTGRLTGQRAGWGGLLLGALLVADLARADWPWIIYWNWEQKYASNPVLDLLLEKPYEHRAALLPFNPPRQLALLHDVYEHESAQHLFPYYKLQ